MSTQNNEILCLISRQNPDTNPHSLPWSHLHFLTTTSEHEIFGLQYSMPTHYPTVSVAHGHLCNTVNDRESAVFEVLSLEPAKKQLPWRAGENSDPAFFKQELPTLINPQQMFLRMFAGLSFAPAIHFSNKSTPPQPDGLEIVGLMVRRKWFVEVAGIAVNPISLPHVKSIAKGLTTYCTSELTRIRNGRYRSAHGALPNDNRHREYCCLLRHSHGIHVEWTHRLFGNR
ncbi:hypothetical protein HYPSUDRAFT_359175 [Hypholoma sublateritium FD-334 SS-4]|uniref:Uncharacterized protein n=1 Tax=Hypholoma sublateritium (strain FD-334 SS-4) TaxID=945553 RepID=A0A0D2P5B1_HYPSF|nr:hypothetical protein HYPSUDRAFT_359175 [Hypholoma sublateritium FD-334 SS-4]